MHTPKSDAVQIPEYISEEDEWWYSVFTIYWIPSQHFDVSIRWSVKSELLALNSPEPCVSKRPMEVCQLLYGWFDVYYYSWKIAYLIENA